MQDHGQFDEFLDAAFVVLINFLAKAPEQIKTVQYPGQNHTCLTQLCQLIAHVFNLSDLLEDEVQAFTGILLANAILENCKDVGPMVIPGLMSMYLQQLNKCDTEHFKQKLLSGICMCLYFDYLTTV